MKARTEEEGIYTLPIIMVGIFVILMIGAVGMAFHDHDHAGESKDLPVAASSNTSEENFAPTFGMKDASSFLFSWLTSPQTEVVVDQSPAPSETP